MAVQRMLFANLRKSLGHITVSVKLDLLETEKNIVEKTAILMAFLTKVKIKCLKSVFKMLNFQF